MKVRNDHWSLLLDFAERNPNILNNKFNGPAGKAQGKAIWQNLAQQLNALGFGEKSVEEWRRALTDWKSKTKAKAAKLRREQETTGGGPAIYPPLSDIEKKLSSLIGTVAVEGDPGVEEIGLGEDIAVDITPIVPPRTPSVVTDHCYVGSGEHRRKRGRSPTGTTLKVRRVRKEPTLRMSKELLDINRESLDVLRSIDTNLGIIGAALTTIAEKL